MPVFGESKMASYPGLNEVATALWRKWLELYEDRFDSFEYNVRVGQGLDPGPSATPEMREMWRMVTTKRIDVVAERENQTWVIEIEERPGLRTFGQVLGYLDLLPKYRAVRAILIGGLVSARLGFDMKGLFRSNEVLYFVFQPGSLPNLPPTFQPSFLSDQTVRFNR